MEMLSNNPNEGSDARSDLLPPLQKKSGEFVLFNKIQGALRHVPNFTETCKAVLEAITDEMNAENCSLMLRDPVSNELYIRAAKGKNEIETSYYPNHIDSGTQFKPGEGVAGWVLEKGHAVLLNDVKEEPRFVKVNGHNDHVRSLICVPVMERNQVVGVFNLSHSKPEAFDEKDKLTLHYISGQVGAALTSTQFFLGIQGIHCPIKDPNKSCIVRDDAPIMNPYASTWGEVGKMTSKNEIFMCASEKMHRIKEMINQVANTDVTVLIQGESGVGKEVVARSIHEKSLRRDKPFVKVNCAAIPEDLLESELFGYERGAFTGAYRQKLGKFEVAHGGTIFLDEIVEIPLSLQAKLLQVLQDREFTRLGGKKDVRVDIRVIAATNRNVEDFVRNGRIRDDLYYRLKVVEIHIPPLRDRREEIPAFVEYFLDKFGKKYNKTLEPLHGHLVTMLQKNHWPGNVRELENVIHRFVVFGNEEILTEPLRPLVTEDRSEKRKELPPSCKAGPSLREAHREAISKTESEIICRILDQTNWNRKQSARLLNISYKALLYKIKQYGIHKQ